MKERSARNRTLINTGFMVFCGALLLFLYLAPEETTTPLPRDETHIEFHQMDSKKEADRLCAQCHNQDGEMPLPDDHPDPFRCLFCHKR